MDVGLLVFLSHVTVGRLFAHFRGTDGPAEVEWPATSPYDVSETD